jgi:hypothetical protein
MGGLAVLVFITGLIILRRQRRAPIRKGAVLPFTVTRPYPDLLNEKPRIGGVSTPPSTEVVGFLANTSAIMGKSGSPFGSHSVDARYSTRVDIGDRPEQPSRPTGMGTPPSTAIVGFLASTSSITGKSRPNIGNHSISARNSNRVGIGGQFGQPSRDVTRDQDTRQGLGGARGDVFDELPPDYASAWGDEHVRSRRL